MSTPSPKIDKNSLVKNILALSDRGVSFRVIQSIMRANGAKIRSWDEVGEAIKSVKDGEQALLEIQVAVADLLQGSYFYWNQTVKFFTAPPKLLPQIKKVFSSAAISASLKASAYSKQYPYILSSDQLNEIKAQPGFAAYREFEAFKSILLGQKSYYTDKLTRLYDDLETDGEKDASSLLFPEGFDQIVAIRRVPFSYYFSISLTDEDTLEVRIESVASIQENMDNVDQAVSFFDKLFTSTYGIKDAFSSPMNLFPAIQKLYDQKDGKIVDDKFSTGSGMLGNNKMRFADADIRSDSYHAGGEQAIKAALKHFGIVKTWDLHKERHSCQPTIALTARPQDLLKKPAEQHLDIAIIFHCGTEEDYKHVRRKLFLAAGL